MIEIKTFNEDKDGFELMIHVEGEGHMILKELCNIFDKIYEQNPKLFEAALLCSQYTEDHI